jgi:uncharacterized protein (TIGR03067 family)
MKWPHLFFVVLILSSIPACSRLRSPAAAPPAASPDLAKSELDRLQGSWRIESSLWNGVADPEVIKSVTIVIQGDNFIWVDRDGNRRMDTIRLMPEQNPRAIDYWSKGENQASFGIYSLEADAFTWCSAGGNNKVRPTSFASERGSKQSLMVRGRPHEGQVSRQNRRARRHRRSATFFQPLWSPGRDSSPPAREHSACRADLSALRSSACARMSMCPPRRTPQHKLNSVWWTDAR